jgi:hypothetical protein
VSAKTANSVLDLILHTDVEESEYPIYVTDTREIWLKARPHRLEQPKTDYEYPKRVYDVPILATFLVKSAQQTNDGTHELYAQATQALAEISKAEPRVTRFEVTYEVWKGDRERPLGEAKGYIIYLDSQTTPFSGGRFAASRAWAVGFDWKKRLVAKYPQLEKFVQLKGKEVRRGGADVWLRIRLPVATPQLERLFNMAVSSSQVGANYELERQVEALKQAIEQKRAELKALQEQLDALLLKLQLEKLKSVMVE